MEARLPFSATGGGDPQFGGDTQYGDIGALQQQNGLEPLPGAGNELNGSNPAQPALVGVWGTAAPSFFIPPTDFLAFNNPSWIPNDRTQNPATTPDNNGLPINVYQEVGTPSGILNFNIGANTGIAHGKPSPVGREVPTASRPTRIEPTFAQAIEQPLDELLFNENGEKKDDDRGGQKPEQPAVPVLSQTDRPEPQMSPMEAMEQAGPLAIHELSALHVPATLDDTAGARLDQAIVDRMMAEDNTVSLPASTGLCEVTTAEPNDSSGENGGVQAVFASLAVGATIVVPHPATGTSLAELIVRVIKEPWPPTRDGHGNNRLNR